MVPITELAEVIRSKNAGPFKITFDVIFKRKEDYEYIKKANFFTEELISRLYGIAPGKVAKIVYFDPANAVKASIIRTVVAGAPGDTDVYGAQQHAPLLALEVPMPDDVG